MIWVIAEKWDPRSLGGSLGCDPKVILLGGTLMWDLRANDRRTVFIHMKKQVIALYLIY